MSTNLMLENILDDAAFYSLEHQLRLVDVAGNQDWNVDFDRGQLSFIGDNPLTAERIHFLGTAAPGPKSWLWSWANPAAYSDAIRQRAEAVRDFAAAHSISSLAQPEMPFAQLPADSVNASLAAGIMTEAAKVITGTWTSYTFDAGSGTRAALLIEHPSFVLGAPDPARIGRVLQEGLAGLSLTDHRRAIGSYARLRGLQSTWAADYSSLKLQAPQLDLDVTFDDLGRVTNLTGSLG